MLAEAIKATQEAQEILNRRDDLLQLITEAYEVLKVYFGSSVNYTLNIFEGEELILSVISDKGVDQMLKSMDNFDEYWWLDNINRANGDLIITMEFK